MNFDNFELKENHIKQIEQIIDKKLAAIPRPKP